MTIRNDQPFNLNGRVQRAVRYNSAGKPVQGVVIKSGTQFLDVVKNKHDPSVEKIMKKQIDELFHPER